MFILFLTTVITCKQAIGILNKIQLHPNLPNHVKHELIEIIKSTVPSCPVKIDGSD